MTTEIDTFTPPRTSALIGELFPLLILLVGVETIVDLNATAAVTTAVGFVGPAALLVFAGYRTRRRGGPRRQATAVGFRLLVLETALLIGIGVFKTAIGAEPGLNAAWNTMVQELQQPGAISVPGAVVIAVVIAVLTLAAMVGVYWIEAWLCGAFGYWIAAD